MPDPGQETFYAEAALALGSAPFWQRLRVKASRPGTGPNGEDLAVGREGWLFFPPATETLAYDHDGNLVSDARWSYGWDAENRLIWMEEHVLPGAGPRPARQRLEFGYDAQSRRVSKTVLEKPVATGAWSLLRQRLFRYDGWSMIAEPSRRMEARWTAEFRGCPTGASARMERTSQLDVPVSGPGAGVPRLHRAHAWGLDQSGTLTGAGGVGGLLLSAHHTPLPGGGTQVQTLTPLYDLNGNAVGYADVATGAITHRFEFDPFGAELAIDTLLPNPNDPEPPSFRFSTKYTDVETRLVYYGYRYYWPEMGRWLSRDPIEESGGINLYGMVGNDAVNRVDHLGLIQLPWTSLGSPAGATACAELAAARTLATGGGIIKGAGSVAATTAATMTAAQIAQRIARCKEVHDSYDKFKDGNGKSPCSAATSCTQVSLSIMLLMGEISGRKEYLQLDCDSFIKTTKNHPEALRQNLAAFDKCIEVFNRLCGCCQ